MSLTVPQIKRACQLADAGLSDQAVAIVLNLDYEVEVSREAVRGYRRRIGRVRRESFGSLPGVSKDASANFAGSVKS